MELRLDYRVSLDKLVNFALEENLIQLVDFNTCSKVINGVKKSSLQVWHILNNFYRD